MYGAPLIATQLTDRAARVNRLNIGGVDFSGPVQSTWRAPVQVDPTRLQVTEEGPGGVSSMTLVIPDPNVALTISGGEPVEFWDIANDRPVFLGFVQSFTVDALPVGREVTVECIGIEALLDWLVVPALTVPANTHMAAGVQACVAATTGVNWPLRAFAQAPGTEDATNDQDHPIASIASGFPVTQYDVVLEGQTLRSACNEVIAACNTWVAGTGALVTIDFYSGVRLFPTSIGDEGVITTYTPNDYTVKSVQQSMAGGYIAPSDFSITIDSAGIVRGVYVTGGNAAGSGYVSDGSGIPGPVSQISDSTSTTGTKRDAIAQAYLSQFSQGTRGTFTIDADIPLGWADDNVRVGGTVFMRPDANIWSALTGFTIMQIRKDFGPGFKQTWTVAFGGFPGSAAKTVRRLTRGTRS